MLSLKQQPNLRGYLTTKMLRTLFGTSQSLEEYVPWRISPSWTSRALNSLTLLTSRRYKAMNWKVLLRRRIGSWHRKGRVLICKRKRKRSDSVLWQKPLHRQKNPKNNVTTQRTPPKTSITQRLRTDLGRSVGVTIATQLVWLNRCTGSQPSH